MNSQLDDKKGKREDTEGGKNELTNEKDGRETDGIRESSRAVVDDECTSTLSRLCYKNIRIPSQPGRGSLPQREASNPQSYRTVKQWKIIITGKKKEERNSEDER